MRNLLNELYNWDLFYLTKIENTDRAYKSDLDKLVKAESKLRKAYPESNDILDVYQSADIDLNNLFNRNEFRKDFRTGTQLVLEIIKPIK
ncbi:MAG: myb domain-containing protein [Oscillospiraceae bacterium]|nr:myb domain-containing protein [Oscillospiraceae bacterium]